MLLDIAQILISFFLVALIILQAKGTGLGSAFGAGGGYHTKRGAEKVLFRTTIIIAFCFVAVSLFNSLFQ